jgi:CheY-like chemotaxis protein
MRLLARASLEQSGFVVEEAEDGGMALAVFQGLQPNLIRLDVLMPKPSTPKSLCKGKEKS